MAMKRRPNSDGNIAWFTPRRCYRGRVWLGSKRHYVYGQTRKEVMGKLRTLRSEAEKGLAIGEAKWTTGAWLEEFVAGRAKIGRKPGTIQDYRYYLDYYLIPRLGSIPLKELRRPKLQAFVDQLVREKVLSPRTIRHCITKLRAALNHAVAAGIIETSPAVVIDLPAIHRVEKTPYNLQEAKAFLEAVIDHRFRALFTLSILSGLREGEALALRWSDLDLESGTIEVNNTLHRREGAWYFDSAKTASSNRTVSMVPLLMNVLAQHRESQRAERLLIGDYDKKENPKGWMDSGVVFATHKGGPLLARNVFRDYKKMQKQANLREQTYHDLRHGAANLMMNSGGTSLAEVSKILGHSQLSITSDYYKHLSIESQRATMDKLQAALTS